MSEDDPARDLITKRADYAEAGIPEYWIADPRFQTVTVLPLAEGSCRGHGVFARGERATSRLPGDFAVEGTAIFDFAAR